MAYTKIVISVDRPVLSKAAHKYDMAIERNFLSLRTAAGDAPADSVFQCTVDQTSSEVYFHYRNQVKMRPSTSKFYLSCRTTCFGLSQVLVMFTISL
jgi:hypothetical protein